MKKMNKYTKWMVSVFLTVGITSGMVFAWNGLTATDGDTLTAVKWNNLVTRLETVESELSISYEADGVTRVIINDGSTVGLAGLSCKSILADGLSTGDGNYWIKPDTNPAFEVYCDMTTDGGGWTLVSSFTNNTLIL